MHDPSKTVRENRWVLLAWDARKRRELVAKAFVILAGMLTCFAILVFGG